MKHAYFECTSHICIHLAAYDEYVVHALAGQLVEGDEDDPEDLSYDNSSIHIFNMKVIFQDHSSYGGFSEV